MRKMKTRTIIVLTVLTLLLLGGLSAGGFIYSGFYDIAAQRPHFRFTRLILTSVKRYSVQFHARELSAPNLADKNLIKRGFSLYRKNCVTCHGSPGEARSRVGTGLNPNPPSLVTAKDNWTPEEIAWITANGLKMAGMPAFALGETSEDIWAMTAFTLRLASLSPQEYQSMMEVEKNKSQGTDHLWLGSPRDRKQVAMRGDPERGRKWIRDFGCVSCHHVPGISFVYATAGPPLDAWSKRHYISGQMINTPDNLVDWLMAPQKYEPEGLMPDLDLSQSEAQDIGAYLFSLDGDE